MSYMNERPGGHKLRERQRRELFGSQVVVLSLRVPLSLSLVFSLLCLPLIPVQSQCMRMTRHFKFCALFPISETKMPNIKSQCLSP